MPKIFLTPRNQKWTTVPFLIDQLFLEKVYLVIAYTEKNSGMLLEKKFSRREKLSFQKYSSWSNLAKKNFGPIRMQETQVIGVESVDFGRFFESRLRSTNQRRVFTDRTKRRVLVHSVILNQWFPPKPPRTG